MTAQLMGKWALPWESDEIRATKHKKYFATTHLNKFSANVELKVCFIMAVLNISSVARNQKNRPFMVFIHYIFVL